MVWFRKTSHCTWPIILIVIGALAWVGSRNVKLVVGSVAAFIVIGYFGMWEDTMYNGDYFSRDDCVYWCRYTARYFDGPFDRIQSVITPVLDVMQTIPSFMYLILWMLLVLVKYLAYWQCVFTLSLYRALDKSWHSLG